MLTEIIHYLKRNVTIYAACSCFLPVWAAAILILSVVPPMPGGMNAGPAAHVCAYFILSLAAALRLHAGRARAAFLKGFLAAGSYGALIEIIQGVIPYRCFEASDVGINFGAALLAGAIGGAAARNVRKQGPASGDARRWRNRS